MHTPSHVRYPRTVRSFVIRTGRITSAQERALANLWPRFGLDYQPETLDMEAVFGRKADRVLEIGFGDGESLVRQAAQNADLDYLGVDVHKPGVGHCLIQAEASNVRNLRLIEYDAIDVLQRQLAAGSLHRINLYFPDPWPKKRHHKRRLLQQDFLTLVASKLKPDGSFCIATDWQSYATHIDEIVAASDCFSVLERREHAGDRPLDRPTTRFERRGLKEGHKIVDWRLVPVG